MKYNPIRIQEVTESDLARNERTHYDSSRPMGNVAASIIEAAISACLVGFCDRAIPLVLRSNNWLAQRIAEDEDFGANRNLHRVTLHWAKAIGEWLGEGREVKDIWRKAQLYKEDAWKNESRPWSEAEVIKHGLPDYMVLACQAGAFEDGINMYERWVGEKKVSLRKALNPSEYGYAVCLHQVRNEFNRSDIFDAGKKMLRANLEENWLGGGQFIRAATWLKLVYSYDTSHMTPIKTILCAFENMPNVPRLDFGNRPA